MRISGQNILQEFRRQQYDVARHLPAFEQGAGLGSCQDRQASRDDRPDLARAEQLKERRPIFQQGAHAEVGRAGALEHDLRPIRL